FYFMYNLLFIIFFLFLFFFFFFFSSRRRHTRWPRDWSSDVCSSDLAFTMPDCHALCKDMPQAKEEFQKRFDLSREVINGLGLDESDFEMAIRFTENFYNENKQLIDRKSVV